MLADNFGYTRAFARQLVVRCVEVIRKLGGYDTCLDHAERLMQAQQANYSPEAWLERIRFLQSEAAKDKGIPRLERFVSSQ